MSSAIITLSYKKLLLPGLILSILAGMACKKSSFFTKKIKPEIVLGPGDSRLSAPIIHFSKDTVYVLATNLVRDSGQTMTIEPGTLIKVNNNLSVIINPGGRLDSKGTTGEPVVFTSSAPTGAAGSVAATDPSGQSFWYGIQIHGNPSLANDQGSGVLTYTRIEFAGGIQFSTQYPSLLLDNVSNLTTLENIQVSYSFESPSFEFSGGNANAGNLVSYAAGNSDFYIHGGYQGKLQNLLAYRHPYFAGLSVSNNLGGLVLEDAATFPAISNLTVLGPDNQPGTKDTYGPRFGSLYELAALVTTKGAQFHIRNSVLLGFPKGGWYLDDPNTALSIINGISDFTYSFVHSNDSSRAFYLAPHVYLDRGPKDFKDYMLQPSFENQLFINSSRFKLTDPYNYDMNPNPLPNIGSPLLSGANFEGPVFSDPFFKNVSYLGAFGTDNWLIGWTNFFPLRTSYNN
ncbi:hypothetical protein ACX0G9_04945 [Flavitalea flava]